MIRLLTEIAGKLGGSGGQAGTAPMTKPPEAPGGASTGPSGPTPSDLIGQIRAGLQQDVSSAVRGIMQPGGLPGASAPPLPTPPVVPEPGERAERAAPFGEFPSATVGTASATAERVDSGVIDTIKGLLSELREAGRSALGAVMGGLRSRTPTPPTPQTPFVPPEAAPGGQAAEAAPFPAVERPGAAAFEFPATPPVMPASVTIHAQPAPALPPPPPPPLQPWYPRDVTPPTPQTPAAPPPPPRPRPQGAPVLTPWFPSATRASVPQTPVVAEPRHDRPAATAQTPFPVPPGSAPTGSPLPWDVPTTLTPTSAPTVESPPLPPGLPGGVTTPPPWPFPTPGRAAATVPAGRGDDALSQLLSSVRSLSPPPVPPGLSERIHESGAFAPPHAPALGGEAGRGTGPLSERLVRAMEDLTEELRHSREDRAVAGGASYSPAAAREFAAPIPWDDTLLRRRR
jgi:hypothetical protein